mgnify:CR=1 FL=1
MSPWTLRPRLTVTRLVTVVCLVTILHGLLSCCHTYKKFTHTAGAPPRGRARVRRPYYTLVVTRGFSLYRIGLYVTLLQL